MKNMIVKIFATFFAIGYFPVMPGTFASLVTADLIFTSMMMSYYNWVTALVMLCILPVLFFASIYFVEQYMLHNNLPHDPSEIVIDEVFGQAVALIIPFVCIAFMEHFLTRPGKDGGSKYDILNNNFDLYFGFYLRCDYFVFLFLSFGFFRLFDITKPWIIGFYDKQDTALSVVMDDFMAGLFSGLICLALYLIYRFVIANYRSEL